jgi:hypothetical protein
MSDPVNRIRIPMDQIASLKMECPKHHEFEVFHATPLDDAAKNVRTRDDPMGTWLVEFECGYTYTQDTRDAS